MMTSGGKRKASKGEPWEGSRARAVGSHADSLAAGRGLQRTQQRLEEYLRVRRVEQGGSLRRMLAELRVGSAWLKDQMHRLGIP
jgi:hypothetical protein